MISSFCNFGECVDVERDGECVAVRHSHSTEVSDKLSFTLDEWRTFLLGVKAGEFDV